MNVNRMMDRWLAVEDRIEATGLPRWWFLVTVGDDGSVTVTSDRPGAMGAYMDAIGCAA